MLVKYDVFSCLYWGLAIKHVDCFLLVVLGMLLHALLCFAVEVVEIEIFI
jgi:hypothetical protein